MTSTGTDQPRPPLGDARPPAVGAPLDELYRHLHRHPELSFHEDATAAIVAAELTALGFEVQTGIGGTGVVGVLRRRDGPTVLLRADMDGLPVAEATGLDYASTARGTDPDGRDVPVMHACGHDVHVTCLVGAARRLAADGAWSGALEVLFQPAEELGAGARALVADGLFERVPTPDVVLGQHVAPFPAGFVALQSGPAFAAQDGIRIIFHGRGGHGSRPETTVDPIVLAAATVLRLQSVVSRETSAADRLVITVGSIHAGTKNNVIPDTAEILISMRSFDEHVRDRAIAAVTRIVEGEAAAAGAPQPPTVEHYESFPAVVNDPFAADRTRASLVRRFGEQRVISPGPVTGSEDVGILATAAGAPCSFWLLGGADPASFAEAQSPADLVRIVGGLPSNHSPLYAPVVDPTLSNGVDALVAAAREWLLDLEVSGGARH
ncbi:amidohydrolase [Frigoribacterium sp. VKM Ac-2836]|uniref:amidohydrolase n=1 Tax=Frigoribacterium sp. VKM Ac-2836 TaxID=2739014 RepID=UPI0015650042|nr:amidohydrolase [Frigoribacterium sp. VKM Ac-2836]NRD26291.1 amidohydrolase [Frigoribacterium sp. VKM Ac-2836]